MTLCDNMGKIPQNIINKIYGYIINNRLEKCLEQLKYYKNNYDIDRIYYYGNYNYYMNLQEKKYFCNYIFDKKIHKKNQIHFVNNNISIG